MSQKPLSSHTNGTRTGSVHSSPVEVRDDGLHVVRPHFGAGAADVELMFDGRGWATPPTVWALDTAGNRVAEVPATLEDATLRFRVCTAGSEGGRIYYEIGRPQP